MKRLLLLSLLVVILAGGVAAQDVEVNSIQNHTTEWDYNLWDGDVYSGFRPFNLGDSEYVLFDETGVVEESFNPQDDTTADLYGADINDDFIMVAHEDGLNLYDHSGVLLDEFSHEVGDLAMVEAGPNDDFFVYNYDSEDSIVGEAQIERIEVSGIQEEIIGIIDTSETFNGITSDTGNIFNYDEEEGYVYVLSSGVDSKIIYRDNFNLDDQEFHRSVEDDAEFYRGESGFYGYQNTTTGESTLIDERLGDPETQVSELKGISLSKDDGFGDDDIVLLSTNNASTVEFFDRAEDEILGSYEVEHMPSRRSGFFEPAPRSTGIEGDREEGIFSVSNTNTGQTEFYSYDFPEPAFFNITIASSNSPTYTNDTIVVDYTVENTGELEDTKEVYVATEDSNTHTLDGGESTTGQLNLDGPSEADTYTLTVSTEDSSFNIEHEVLERSMDVTQISPDIGQSIPYWEAVTQAVNFEWTVDTVPEMSYDTGIQLEGQSENLGLSGTGNQSFSTDQTFLSSQTGTIEWTATAEATNYAVSDSSTTVVDIQEPRHEILSVGDVNPVTMVDNDIEYDFVFQYEMGEQVNVGLQGYGSSFHECEQTDGNYQTDGLCERSEERTLTPNLTGTEELTVEIEGDETGVTDSEFIGNVDVYDPAATITGPEDTELDYQDRNQEVSLTWDSVEEDVTTFLYFNGEEISSETLESGQTMTETVEGDVGENEYYFEVEGETSGDSYTFDTRSFSVADYSLNITMDETRFGNNQPLANSPLYFTGSDPELPLEVEDGRYKLGYQDTSWSGLEATHYGWVSENIPVGQREETDDILGEDIGGRVTGDVTVDITYSFDEISSDGDFTVELGDTVGETSTVVEFPSGASASSETVDGLFDLEPSFFDNGLDLAVENNLDQDLEIEEVTINNVEDRPREIWGERFRTVALETESVNEEDLQFWFEIDGEYVSAPIQTDTTQSPYMELREYSGVSTTDIDREGFVATWEQQNRRDTFSLPEETNAYNASIPNAPQSVVAEDESESIILFFFDLNDDVTENYIAENGTLHVTDGELTDSVDFEYSSDVDFRNFRSSSSTETLDTTLKFDSDSNLLSDGQFVSPETNPAIRIERAIDNSVLEPVEDPSGDEFDRSTEISEEDAAFPWTFRNTHSHSIRLYTDLTLGVSDPVYEPNELVEITPTTEVAGSGGWTVGELLQENVDIRELLLEEGNMTRELEIDGDNLERGELIATYQLEDDFENYREEERTFTIRENTFRGKFYQFFDNYFQLPEWIVGLFIFLFIAVGGMLFLDWKISFLVGSTFGLVASVALLWTGFLPLQINLLIMVILAGLSAIALRKVIG